MTVLTKCRALLPKLCRTYCQTAPAMKYLNVAEKNDAAKNIAAHLSRGRSTRREGLSVYNKIYEFEAPVFGQQCKMVMTSVSGHLLTYEFALNFRNWQGCNPLVLFDAPMHKACPQDFTNIKRTLEREIRSCQGLIIWTDCDREGENIGFEVIKVCTDIKPDLRVYRAKFSEITAASVFRALNNLGQPNKNVSDAVDVRQELDLRTGAAFTRLQTLRLQQVFPQKLADKLVSYGSCQFPTLGFVVERYKAIEDFIPENFWKLKLSHTQKTLVTDFLWKRERLFDQFACEAILHHCQEADLATVESVESKPKSKWRPLPLDTVEMEKIISKKLHINAKETMKIAEKLYTQGYISYPRTETNIFPKELNLRGLVEQQQNDGQWGPFAQRVLAEGGPSPRQGRKSDQAHPPIHPTKYAENLQGNEKRVYEYIVRHFLACVHKDAQGFETVVNVDCAGEKFFAKGLVILEKNYLDVYVYEKWTGKEISHYERGDTFRPELGVAEGRTSAPKLLTEADLIALMEKHGIGTDATHAEHIETIKSRQYVGLQDIYFVPGNLGMGLVEGYNEIGLEVSLAKPTLRADFENDLKLICEGLKDPETVRREQIEKYRAVFRTVAEKMRLIDASLAERLQDQPLEPPVAAANEAPYYQPALKCPKCGMDMIVKPRKDGSGLFLTCVGYPNCKNSVWFPGLVKSVEVTPRHCPECGPDFKLLKFTFRPNPFPGEPNPNELCLGGCDENVNEVLNVNLWSVRALRAPGGNAPAGRPTVGTNGGFGGNNGGFGGGNGGFGGNNGGFGGGGNGGSGGGSGGLGGGNGSFGSPSGDSSRGFGNPGGFGGRGSGGASRGGGHPGSRGFGGDDGGRGEASGGFGSSGNTSRGFGNPGAAAGGFGSPAGNLSQTNAAPPSDTDIVCNCNQAAALLTVRKEGPNQGRRFYKCAQSITCNFFLWDPQEGGAAPSAPQNATLRGGGGGEGVRCNCNQPAPLRTVSKETANKGRQFYCCANTVNGCKFFQWADEEQQQGGGGGGDDFGGGGGGNWSFRGRGKKRGNGTTKPYSRGRGEGGRAKRKCGNCGQEGHMKNRCPRNS